MAHEPTTPFSFGRDPARVVPPPLPLFAPAQIAAATAFATPVAGALLVAWNLRRQQRKGPLVALAIGVAVIALALWLDVVWSGAVWWLAVPAWTMLAGVASTALFESAIKLAGRRASSAVWLVCLATVGALYGAGGVASVLAPRAVPGFGEILFNWIGVGPSKVRWAGGATRDDALRVGEAIERGQALHGDARLALEVARDGERLVLRLRLPEASVQAVAGARAITQAVAANLDPAECVTGRIINMAGRTMAEGTSCP